MNENCHSPDFLYKHEFSSPTNYLIFLTTACAGNCSQLLWGRCHRKEVKSPDSTTW